MLTQLAHNIIKFRLPLIIILAVFTAIMAYYGKDVEMSYNFAKVIPKDDEDMRYFESFKTTFGEDGNTVVIGFSDSSIYKNHEQFNQFVSFVESLEKINGVKGSISLANVYRISKDTSEKKFVAEKIYKNSFSSNEELSLYISEVKKQLFYNEQIINYNTGSSLIALNLDPVIVNSVKRDKLIKEIDSVRKSFSQQHNIETHIAGLPYLRSTMTTKVGKELNFFLVLSLGITAVILLFFFRSFFAVVIPLIIIGTIVVWTIGTLALFDYKITLLTGLIPPIIVVIGIPNTVYLLNKYHQEFRKTGNKIKALSLIIRRIGVITLITNLTTAIGFIVFSFTKVSILHEFGIVAGINVMGIFIATIILVPALFAYMPEPNNKQLRHLDFKFFNKSINVLDKIAHNHRVAVYTITILIVAISVYGISKIKTISYMVDDVPKSSNLKEDLKFFENNFSGVMPLELVVNTNEKKGVSKLSTLQKIDELEMFLSSDENISNGISISNFTKAVTQGYYNGNPAFYKLPSNRDKNFISSYMRKSEDEINIKDRFTDSLGQTARISFRVADIGSVKLDSLVKNKLNVGIDSIIQGTKLDAKLTGTTLVFIKGNKFLVKNLQQSLVLAFVLIALIMAMLFGNVKMIFISLVPNFVPLIITGGIMGFFGIPLKPSTAIIFSIAFGIAIDDSIHYLAKYRQELFHFNFNVHKAVSVSLKETGSSMIYTSIILFFGFIIFSFSDFGGTVALGVLTSITLLCAMFTNLILLPSLIISFDDGKRPRRKKMEKKSFMEQYEDFYQEDSDEEINLELLAIKGEGKIADQIYEKEIEELKNKKDSE